MQPLCMCFQPKYLSAQSHRLSTYAQPEIAARGQLLQHRCLFSEVIVRLSVTFVRSLV